MAFLKNKKIIAIMLVIFSCKTFSQEFSLDLQSISQKSKEKSGKKSGEKPTWAASGLNLLVPGTGYFYLGEQKPGVAFLTADLVLLSGFLYTNYTSRERYRSSMAFARLYAGSHSTRPYNDPYWGHLGNKYFMTSEEFNAAMLNVREIDKTYFGSDEWSWESDERRDEYAEIRLKAGHWKTASTLVLGTLALNRLVSFVTARVATKKHNDRLNFSVIPAVSTGVDFQNDMLLAFLFSVKL